MAERAFIAATVFFILASVFVFSWIPNKVEPRASAAGAGSAAADDVGPALQRAMELLSNDSTDEALAELQAAAARAPQNAQVRYYMGAAYEAKGQFEEAQREYELAARYDPTSASALGKVGEMRAQLGDHDGAIAIYRKALAIDPQSAALRNQLGAALTATGAYEQAIAELEAALRMEPENSSFMVNLGGALQGKGDLRAALEWFTKACEAADQTGCSKQQEVSALIR